MLRQISVDGSYFEDVFLGLLLFRAGPALFAEARIPIDGYCDSGA